MFKINSKIFRYVLLSTVLIAVFALAACSGESGGSGSFSTTDNSIDEWENVPVFQTDPAGDVPTPDEDIVEIKVANSPAEGQVKEVFFLMKVAGNPALQGQYRAAAASIDCDGNGNNQDPQDRLIVYVVSEDQYYIMRGDQSEFFSGKDKDGQVVGDYVEWKVAVSDLPPDEKDNVQCTGSVKLLFGTADVVEYYETKPSEAQSNAYLIDETDSLKDWSIP